jgi:hypothetical protein
VSVAALALTERQFERQVRDLAALRGWKCHKHWLSIHSPAGWPDLFLYRGDVNARAASP